MPPGMKRRWHGRAHWNAASQRQGGEAAGGGLAQLVISLQLLRVTALIPQAPCFPCLQKTGICRRATEKVGFWRDNQCWWGLKRQDRALGAGHEGLREGSFV